MLMFFKFIERLIYFFFDVQYDWEIGFLKMSVEDYVFSSKRKKIKWLKMPRDVFWADPFILYRNSQYYVFYEELNKNKGYGTINCMVFDSSMKMLSNDIVIDEGVHFSFPYLIEEGKDIYMLPETSLKNELALYKAIDFPLIWEKQSVLLNLPAMDSIVFREGGYWHLLYSDANRDDGSLFYRKSKDLVISWEPIEEVLISKSFHNTRSAGNVVKYNDQLYRPTQKCDNYYGESIVINKINLNELVESEFKVIDNNHYFIKGFHTLSFVKNVIFVDRRRYRLYFNWFKKILK